MTQAAHVGGSHKPVWIFGLAGSSLTLGLGLILPTYCRAPSLALLVMVVGLPHGGLDYRVGRELCRNRIGRRWWLIFLGAYVAVMAAVLLGWIVCPLICLAGFVLLSSAHFGWADDPEVDLPTALIRGGMVVWVPALLQPTEMTMLLDLVVPYGLWPSALLFERNVRTALLAMAAVVIAMAARSPISSACRIVCFWVMFASVPPLISFAVYFCGWHSVIELVRLAKQADPGDLKSGLIRVASVAAPFAGLASALGVAGWAVSGGDGQTEPQIVQAIFVGLSVVAVPHLLLDYLAVRTGVNPFKAENNR